MRGERRKSNQKSSVMKALQNNVIAGWVRFGADGMSKTGATGQAIRLTGIGKNWGATTALEGVAVDIPAGSFTVLLGPSGCGKSTLLRLISGLETPSEGQVWIGGKDATKLPADKRGLSMVFQNYALFPHLSVGDNITFGLQSRKVRRAEREARLRETATLLGLEKLLDRKPAQLSGGQQQRVALGRAIIAERPICLMDEPLSNLDAKLRQEMRVELRALQQKLGFTMVYVTHDQAEAMTMADQVILLNQGRIEQADSPRALYEQPQTVFAARFIGTPPMNLIEAAALGAGAETLIGLRPEAISLGASGLPATITGVEYFGPDSLLTCAIGTAGVQDQIIARAPGQGHYAPGQPVHLRFAPEDLHVFGKTTGARSQTTPPLSLQQGVPNDEPSENDSRWHRFGAGFRDALLGRGS